MSSGVSLALEAEHVVARLRHLLEVRRKLLAERRLQVARWRALRAASHVLLAEPVPPRTWMGRTSQLLLQLPDAARRLDGADHIEPLHVPNDRKHLLECLPAGDREPLS